MDYQKPCQYSIRLIDRLKSLDTKNVLDFDLINKAIYWAKKYHGDQDYITEAIPISQRRFFNTDWVKSWRWQCLDGGYNFSRRIYLAPGNGTTVDKNTSILVFHGNPKPHAVTDAIIIKHWQ